MELWFSKYVTENCRLVVQLAEIWRVRCSDDGFTSGRHLGGAGRVLLRWRRAAQEVPGYGLSRRHGEEPEQPGPLFQVRIRVPFWFLPELNLEQEAVL